MDARLIPARFLGLEEGEAHVIRNAGGEALRSLAVSQHLVGTNEIALIRHTDCGMAKFSNEEIAEKVADASGGDRAGSTSGRSRISSRPSATTSSSCASRC
jgi:carbonic anhydrase